MLAAPAFMFAMGVAYSRRNDAMTMLQRSIKLVGMGHFLMPNEPKVVYDEVKQIASDVTRIYLIHWVFVSYLVGGVLDGVLHFKPHQFVVFFIGIVILVISTWLARQKPFTNIKI